MGQGIGGERSMNLLIFSSLVGLALCSTIKDDKYLEEKKQLYEILQNKVTKQQDTHYHPPQYDQPDRPYQNLYSDHAYQNLYSDHIHDNSIDHFDEYYRDREDDG